MRVVRSQKRRHPKVRNITWTLEESVCIIPSPLIGTFSTLSHQEYGKGYLLERDSLEWYRKQYIGDKDPTDPRISPLFASDFSSLPPAFIITAEFDPIRDEGEAYVQKLKTSGVPVIHKRYKGMVHGFFQMAGLLDEARLAIEEVGQTLRQVFETQTAT